MQMSISLKMNLPVKFSAYLKTCVAIFNRYDGWSFDNYRIAGICHE